MRPATPRHRPPDTPVRPASAPSVPIQPVAPRVPSSAAWGRGAAAPRARPVAPTSVQNRPRSSNRSAPPDASASNADCALNANCAALASSLPSGHLKPPPACRNIWRTVRRKGAEPTRRVLEEKPQTFGRLYAVRLTRFSVFPYNDSTMAREIGLLSLLRCFDAVIEARVKRKVAEAGPTFRACARMVKMRAAAYAVARPQRYGKPVDKAGHLILIAVRMRRRDVGEPRDERNPLPKVRDQLAAMLPAEARRAHRRGFPRQPQALWRTPRWTRGQGRGGRVRARPGQAPVHVSRAAARA